MEVLNKEISLKSLLGKGMKGESGEITPVKTEIQQRAESLINGDGDLKAVNTYVNPSEVTEINALELEAILRGNIINPDIPEQSDINSDYKFFLVCSFGELNGISEKFEAEMSNALYDTEWFALISCNSRSSMIFPGKGTVDFDVLCKLKFTNKNIENVWKSGGGYFNLNENIGKKVIRCRVNKLDVMRMFNKIYS